MRDSVLYIKRSILLLMLALVPVSTVHATVVVVATVANGSVVPAATTITSSAINTTSSSVIVVYVNDFKSVPVGTLTDTYGNTWSLLNNGSSVNDGASRGLFYACLTPTTGAGHTFTYTATGQTYPTIYALAAYGSSTVTSTVDQQSYNAPAAAAVTGGGGSITPTSNDELVISLISPSAATAYSPSQPAGYTLVGSFGFGAPFHFASALAYQIQTTATTTNPTWDFTPSSNYSAGTVSFTLKIPTAPPPSVSGSFMPMFQMISE